MPEGLCQGIAAECWDISPGLGSGEVAPAKVSKVALPARGSSRTPANVRNVHGDHGVRVRPSRGVNPVTSIDPALPVVGRHSPALAQFDDCVLLARSNQTNRTSRAILSLRSVARAASSSLSHERGAVGQRFLTEGYCRVIPLV